MFINKIKYTVGCKCLIIILISLKHIKHFHKYFFFMLAIEIIQQTSNHIEYNNN